MPDGISQFLPAPDPRGTPTGTGASTSSGVSQFLPDAPQEGFAPQSAVSDFIDQPVDGRNLADEFVAGVGGGVDSLQMSLFGVVGLAGRELGIKPLEDFGIRGAERNEAEAAQSGREAGGFTDIESVGGFFKWAAASLGEALPSLGLAVAGGGVGGAIAGSIGKKVIENQIRKTLRDRIAKTLRRKSGQRAGDAAADRIMRSAQGERLIANAVMRGKTTQQLTAEAFRTSVNTGRAVGAIGASSLPQTGQIDLELRAAGIDAGFTSVAGGLLGGAFEGLPALRILNRAFPGVETQVAKNFVKDFAVSAGIQSTLEGGTEAAQETIQLAAMAYHDPSFDLFDPDNAKRVIDAFAAGALVGAVTGAGADLVGGGTRQVRKTKAAVAKSTLPAFSLGLDKIGLPDGFEAADNTVFEEVLGRINDKVAPVIEPIVNGARNAAQAAVDALDKDLSGGMNEETAKFSQLVASIHNRFVEEHKQDFADLRDYVKAKAVAITARLRNVNDPEAREAQMKEEVDKLREEIEAFTAKLKEDAAKRDQQVQGEVENTDFADLPFIPEDDRDVGDEEITEDEVTETPSDTVAEDDVLFSAPEKFVVGKHQREGTLAPGGEVEVVGYDNRRQARKGLATLRKEFPSATDSTFEIREQADGTFVIGLANIGKAEALLADKRVTEAIKESRQTSEGRNPDPNRMFKPEGKSRMDMLTLAFAGQSLTPETDVDLSTGLKNMAARLFERGILTGKEVEAMLAKFNKDKAKIKLDDHAPPTVFPTVGLAQRAMIQFRKSLEGTGHTLSRDALQVFTVEGGFTFGLNPNVARPPKAVINRLIQDRRDKKLENFKDQGGPAIAVGAPTTRAQDPSGQRELFGVQGAQSGGDIGVTTPDTAATQRTQRVTGTPGAREVGAAVQVQDPSGVTAPGEPTAPGQTVASETGQATRDQAVLRPLEEGERTTVDDPRRAPDAETTAEREGREIQELQDEELLGPREPRKADPRSADKRAETRKIMKRAGKTAFLIGDLVDPTGVIKKNIKRMTNFVYEKFGMRNPLVVMDSAGLRNLIETGLVTDPIFQKTLDGTSLARIIRAGDDTLYIYLSDKVLADPVQTTLALGHELGHALMWTNWSRLTTAAQDRLTAAYLESGGPESFVGTSAENLTAAQQFDEWMADQLAVWIVKNTEPKGLVEQFFHDVAAQVKDLYDYLSGTTQRAPTRFVLNETFGEFAQAVIAKAGNEQTLGSSRLTEEQVEAWFKDQGATGYKWWGALPSKADMVVPQSPNVSDSTNNDIQARFEKAYPVVAKRGIAVRNWMVAAFKMVLAPSTSVMRSLGKRVPAAKKLVTIFSRENMGDPKLGSNYHQRKQLFKGRFMQGPQGYDKIMEGVPDVERAQMARRMREAEGNPDFNYTEREQALRKLFDDMHAYARKNGLPVKHIDNYFPRQFSRQALVDNKQSILDHLMEQGKSLSEARSYYNGLVSQEAQDGRATGDAIETPGFRNMNSREQTDPFFDQFLDDNLDGIVSNYVTSVTNRAEFNRALGQPANPIDTLTAQQQISQGFWDPKRKFNEILKQAREEGASDEDLKFMERYVDANLGQLGRDDISPGMRKFMAGVMAYQNMRVLLFTVFASFPDIMGPAMRSKSMRGAFTSMRKNIGDIVSNDNDLADAARALGLINTAMNNHIMTEYVDNHHMPPTLRKWNDAFFKWTGLNWWTDATRKAALAVGIDYFQQQAQLATDPNLDQLDAVQRKKDQALEALQEFGLTPGDVEAWVSDGKPVFGSIDMGDLHLKVAEGLVQFVDESIMRPNASQRPIMASHPSAMLVFHLKGFMYAAGDIMGARLVHNVKTADTPSQQLAMLAPAAGILALTAIGLELRELIQYAGSNRKPPTDRMTGYEYVVELFERSGMGGASQLAFDYEGADERGMSGLAALSGPTLNQVGDFMSKPSTQTIPKALPVIGQLPEARARVRDVIR